MDRQALFLGMAQRLRGAYSTSNWRELKAVDAELALLLRRLTASKTWTKAERGALTDLRRAHDEAGEHCAREAALYQARMAGMRENRIGWLAYAAQNEQGASLK